MADNATRALGAPEVAGAFVNPKGLAKKMTASVAGGQLAGAIGSAAASIVSDRRSGTVGELPSFGRVGYLAVSESEVALVKAKMGAIRTKVGDEVLARAPRSWVTSAELDQGVLLSHLTIEFSDGASWQFDVPRQGRRAAQAVIDVLDVTRV